MKNDERASKIVSQMLENDPFSRWLDIEVLEVREGFCKAGMTVRDEMLNGFGVTHGGILFSLADSALAFASATYGKISFGIDHSISFTKKTGNGDYLTAEASCIYQGNQTGVVQVIINNQKNQTVAVLKGTIFRTEKEIIA